MDLERFYSHLLLQWQVITEALTPLLTRLCLDKHFSLVTTIPWVRTCGATTACELSGNLVGHASRECGCGRNITSSLAEDWFQSHIWKNVKPQSSLESTTQTALSPTPRLVTAIGLPSREKALCPRSWILLNFASWSKNQNKSVTYSRL